ncbi:hypothetical protein INT45_006015 [Circinella minor]|uniref:Reverse transcriptase zinc-binding domain-containing protein n=1 Tax=Circinella minor TaxID=1195481 RepID=A0A8H7VRQ6_9FUNG|nr:hypothetical protein INT45_006015 [Circinella minor]
MQIRWLSSFFTHSSSLSFLSCFLSYFITSNSNCTDPLLPILFPSLQSSTLCSMNTLSTLFTTIDELPLQPLLSDPSMAICLSLPLSFVIQASAQSNFLPKKQLSSLIVSDAYLFDSTINRLRRRTRVELTIGRNSILHLFHALDSGDVLIADFLARALLPGAPILDSADFYIGRVDAQPFYNRLNIDHIPLHLCSTRTYRLARQQSAINIITTNNSYPTLTPSKWQFFWKARIMPLARSIWWRSLHGKLSCRSTLHHILPARFDNALCALGDLENDSVSHFLFSCDTKWIIWQQVLQDCVLTSVTQDTVHDAIFSFTMPTWDLSHSPLSPIQIISGTMVSIWKAHWLYIFSSVPFCPTTIIDSTHKTLIRFRQEETLFIHQPP